MFGFITKMFKRKPGSLQSPVIDLVVPEEIKADSRILDPSKSSVVKETGDMPGTVVENGIKRDVGHVNFNNTKSITRSYKRAKLRQSLEERKSSYYDDDGIVYLG